MSLPLIESMLVDFLRPSVCMKTALSPQLYKTFVHEDKSEEVYLDVLSEEMMGGPQQTV